MALVACTECKKEISDEAKACPHCAHEVPQGPGPLKIVVIGFLCIAIVKGVWDSNNSPPPAQKTPEEIAAAAKKEAEFQRVVGMLQRVKSNMKNPASFDLVNATLMADGALCVEYRGTNGFNAIVTERRAVTATIANAPWNKVCAGRSGSDFTYAKHAL